MRNQLLLTSLALACVACTGRTVDCATTPSDPVCPQDSGPPVDMGTDTGPVDAHVACNGMCSGTTPHCLVSGTSETCVGCLAEGDCSGTTPHCDTMGGHTCVACLSDMQCPMAATAACNTTSHTCEACTSSTQCAHLTATPVCVTTGAMTGTCAQCNTNADCTGPNTGCDTSTHMCVSYTPDSAGPCTACVADAQCHAGQLCVPLTYTDPTMAGAMPEAVGNRCMWRQDATGMGGPHGDCLTVAPYAVASMLTSVDATSATMCVFRRSTCEAQADFAMRNCTLDMTGDESCGASGVHDGVCRNYSGATNRCTVFCLNSDDCRGAACDTAATPAVCRFM
jgi:hypothetical protein